MSYQQEITGVGGSLYWCDLYTGISAAFSCACEMEKIAYNDIKYACIDFLEQVCHILQKSVCCL